MVKNKLARAIETILSLFIITIAIKNKIIIIGKEVLGKNISFSPSEKLLSSIPVIKII